MDLSPAAADDPDSVVIRPMSDTDVPTARAVAWDALVEAGRRYGWGMPPLDDTIRARGEAQFRHLRRTDPDGLAVADRDGAVRGVAVATRRGPLWFLSLLTVAPSLQAQGVGRRLLDTVSATRGGLAALCASDDPKALRRYRRAGFDLHPGYEAKGPLDRGVLPAGQQWALDVVLAARLALRPSGSVCRSGVGPSGVPPPWAPYLPSGSLG